MASRPDSGVSFFVCAGDPADEACQYLPNFGIVDGSGPEPTDVTVWATVPTETGDIECRAESCELVASPGSSGSARAGRASLHFDADAPLQPGPALTVEPSTGVPDEAVVTVTGTHFTPDGWAQVAACEASSGFGNCDPQSEAVVTPDAHGGFTTELSVAATFTTWNGHPVDCRAAPGCVIRAQDGPRLRRVEVPLAFAPPASSGVRYVDPVFDEVDVTHDLVYQETVDVHGHPVQLTLDVYEPAGDTAAKRPAVVWMHGGWFSDGDKADMAAYAEAFARRGDVAVSMEYRMRPGLDCCPTRDAVGITGALLDGHEDAMAGLEWLHEHAAEHRIDPEAIAAGGDGARAANSFGLAFPPDHTPHPGPGHEMVQPAAMDDAEEPLIAAALPISGVSLGAPGEGAPPVLAFHGSEDSSAPAHLTESNCAAAEAGGSRCDVVSYVGAFGDIAVTRQRDIIRRSADFLAEAVLEPLATSRSHPSSSPPPPPPRPQPARPTRPPPRTAPQRPPREGLASPDGIGRLAAGVAGSRSGRIRRRHDHLPAPGGAAARHLRRHGGAHGPTGAGWSSRTTRRPPRTHRRRAATPSPQPRRRPHRHQRSPRRPRSPTLLKRIPRLTPPTSLGRTPRRRRRPIRRRTTPRS